MCQSFLSVVLLSVLTWSHPINRNRSQALRETKELKWLDIDQKDKKKGVSAKDIVCPFCNKIGHKTRIAKACLLHHQWLDAGKSDEKASTQPHTDTETSNDGTDEKKDDASSYHPPTGITDELSGPIEANETVPFAVETPEPNPKFMATV
jgi:hypothetical protein